jgi:hypothetical protein
MKVIIEPLGVVEAILIPITRLLLGVVEGKELHHQVVSVVEEVEVHQEEVLGVVEQAAEEEGK